MAQLSSALALALCVLVPLAHADDVPPVRAKVQASIPLSTARSVDVQRILQDSRASRSAQTQLEDLREGYRQQIAREEAALRKAERDLQEVRGKLTPSEYAQREADLRRKIEAMEQAVQERRRNLESAFSAAMGEVRAVLLKVVENLARERGIAFVFARQQILWQDPAADITEDVLAEMDRQLPSITLKGQDDYTKAPGSPAGLDKSP